MRFAQTIRLAAAAGLGATALTVVGLAAPAQARVDDSGAECLTPTPGAAAAARGGTRGVDHPAISAAEQLAIARRTSSRLAAKGAPSLRSTALARTVPVHFHVMRDAAGRGDVTNRQIGRQIAVLNHDFAGTGFRFRLVDHPPLQQHRLAQGQPVRPLPRPDPQGRRERPEHLARRLPVPRGRHLPLGLRQEAARSTASASTTTPCPAAASPTSTWAGPRRTRRATGSVSTTPSRAAAPTSTTRSTTRRPR